MKLYGIYQGCKFEGGFVGPTLFLNQADAIEELKRIVEDHNKYWYDEIDFQLTETSPVLYENQHDVACIKEFKTA